MSCPWPVGYEDGAREAPRTTGRRAGRRAEAGMNAAMKKRARPFVAGAVLCGVCAVASAGSGGRPNVIVIMADDQGYGDIKAHGHPFM